jgi:hypothetical protein
VVETWRAGATSEEVLIGSSAWTPSVDKEYARLAAEGLGGEGSATLGLLEEAIFSFNLIGHSQSSERLHSV